MSVTDESPASVTGMSRTQRLGTKADEWALSSDSEIARDHFARVASSGRVDFEELLELVKEGDVSGLRPNWTARLARLVALQAVDEESRDRATNFLSQVLAAFPNLPDGVTYRKLLVELLLSKRDLAKAAQVLAADDALGRDYHGYLLADAINPFVSHHQVDFAEWLELFNRPFTDRGLSAVAVGHQHDSAFNSLSSTTSRKIDGGPLVSVIFTTFKPDADELATSVRSILDQTWTNLELLLVDDASGPEYEDLLDSMARLDDRVKLIRMPTNGGTYRARNAGLKAAAGEYMTGQDTDDWSHPERLEVQVGTLIAHPHAVGVTTSANRTDDNLVRAAIGNKPHRRCEVSLMVRTSDARQIGGYLRVRRGADSEFRERIEIWSGREVVALEDPLYIIRMSPGSLSRSDFRPGWSHHARRAFWSAYRLWHATARRPDLVLASEAETAEAQMDIPPRIMGELGSSGRIDVCFVADWRGSSPVQRAAMDELIALSEVGMSVAILHLDSPFSTSSAPRALAPEIQKMINAGVVRRVYDDVDDEVDLVVVRDPVVVHFGRSDRSMIQARRVLVVCDGCAPSIPKEEQLFDPPRVASVVRTKFGRTPHWISVLPTGCAHDAPADAEYQHSTYPMALGSKWFYGYRRQLKPSELLTVGRSAANSDWDWPRRSDCRIAFPADDSIDVRVHGDARGGVRALRLQELPANWLQFRENEISADVFWSSLDFVVDIPRANRVSSAAYRSIVEAMAVGTVVATTKEMAELLGGCVIEATGASVYEELAAYINDQLKYQEMAERGRRSVEENCSPSRFVDFILEQIQLLNIEGENSEP